MTIYHPSIPQAGDDPSNSQQDLLDNFQKLNADFSVNHMPFTSGGNAGWHKLVQFVTAINTPGYTSGSASALFPRIDHSGSPTDRAQLWFKNNNDRYQLTGISVTNASSQHYGFKTPWGVTFNFGQTTFTGGSRPFSVPFSDTPYFMVATAIGNSGVAVAVRNLTATTFEGVSVGGSQPCYYFAIGPSTVTA